jgi:hypothetical protein
MKIPEKLLVKKHQVINLSVLSSINVAKNTFVWTTTIF